MASATVSKELSVEDQAKRVLDAPSPRKPKSTALKRPDGLSDTEWLIMKAARNEDVPKRISEILSDQGKPSSPEEAAILMEIVSGVEYACLKRIKALREGVAPKIKAEAATANALTDIKVKLFRLATAL